MEEITFNILQQGLTAMKAQIETLQQQLSMLEKQMKKTDKESAAGAGAAQASAAGAVQASDAGAGAAQASAAVPSAALPSASAAASKVGKPTKAAKKTLSVETGAAIGLTVAGLVMAGASVEAPSTSTAAPSASTAAQSASTSVAAPSTAGTSVAGTPAPSEKKQKKITGFCVAEPLSADLCEFMKLPPNSAAARNAVSTAIITYIRTNKLQDSDERKNIKADAALKSLFKLRDDEQLTYFNLQKYISMLFKTSHL